MRILFCALLFSSLFGYSQQENAEDNKYAAVDEKVQNYPEFPNLSSLAMRIENDFSETDERARAVYYWITQNIVYNQQAYLAYRRRIQPSILAGEQIEYVESPDQARVAEAIFFRRKTLSYGYAVLFNELAGRVGLHSNLIKGVIKTSARDINGDSPLPEHYWNAVLVEAEWKLIDLTWASGTLDPVTKRWKAQQNDFYYFTPPEVFITSHFPENPTWQLMGYKILLEEFVSWPVFYPGYFQFELELEASVPGTLTRSESRRLTIQMGNLYDDDWLFYAYDYKDYLLEAGIRKTESKYNDVFVLVPRKTPRYLTLYLGSEPIIDFKIK